MVRVRRAPLPRWQFMATSQKSELPDSSEISRHALDQALSGILATSLRSVCLGLALFYALLTGWYLVQYDGPAQISLSLSTALLSLGLLAGAVWFARNQLPAWLAHPVAALIAIAIGLELPVRAGDDSGSAPDHEPDDRAARLRLPAVLDELVHGARAARDRSAGRGSRAITRGELDWAHFGLALLEAHAFGGLVLYVRLRAYRNIQTLRMRDQILVQNLREANRGRAGRGARQERVPRQHEPRDPHADDGDARHDRAAAADAARRAPARVRDDDRALRRHAAAARQRHPRLLEDRGRPARARRRRARPRAH